MLQKCEGIFRAVTPRFVLASDSAFLIFTYTSAMLIQYVTFPTLLLAIFVCPALNLSVIPCRRCFIQIF